MIQKMKRLLDLLSATQPKAGRLFILIVSLLAAFRLLPSGWAIKGVVALLLVSVLWKIFVEWQSVLPAFYRMVIRRFMRLMRTLRPLHRVPPDVPVFYGLAMMYLTLWVALLILQRSPLVPSTAEMLILGSLISFGALRHSYAMIRTVAKWSWSKSFGKVAYGVVTAICLALAHADATRMTRRLTHADAKYFPSFMGLLSSWYGLLNLVQCAAAIMASCALLLLLTNIPSLFLRNACNQLPFPLHRVGGGLSLWWRRIRFGCSPAPVLTEKPYLRDVVDLLTPLGLVCFAALLSTAPAKIMSAGETKPFLAQLLFRMEYTADGDCPNVKDNMPTVHLDGDFVSVATFAEGKLNAIRMVCHNSK